jgi:hypothetical protein
MLARIQFAQGFSRKKPLQIKELHENYRPMTGAMPFRASIGAAVEFWTRASIGPAGG